MSAGPVALRFVTSGGTATGMGHLMRCATLAEEALELGLPIDFAVRGDSAALAALAGQIPAVAMRQWEHATGLTDGATALVVDTREPIDDALSEARRRGVATTVLDRADHLDGAALTVLPVAHAARIDHPRLLAGAAYCPLPRALRRIEAPPLSTRRQALLTLGGADPHRATLPLAAILAEGLDAADRGDWTRHVVIGPAFERTEALARSLEAEGWVVHRAPDRATLLARMALTAFAIVGFGNSVYELAWLGVPQIYWTHRASDLEDADRLEALGLGRVGGAASRLDAGAARDRLRAALAAPDWAARSSASGRTLLGDGGGARRIVECALEAKPR